MLLSSDGHQVVKNSCREPNILYRLDLVAQFKGPHTFKREGSTRIPTRYITIFHCGPTNLNDPLLKSPHQGTPA